MDRAERRRVILEAALSVFAEAGYRDAKLDEVARRAAVAKGTLYLYFKDKDALFQGLVEELVTPILIDADALVSAFPGNTRDLLDQLMELLVARILEGPAVTLLRLMMREGYRFPELTTFYHREVVSRGLEVIRKVARHGRARGEFSSDVIERFPQLVVSPALLTIVWNSLFGAIDPLDPRPLLAAYRDLLLRGLEWRAP